MTNQTAIVFLQRCWCSEVEIFLASRMANYAMVKRWKNVLHVIKVSCPTPLSRYLLKEFKFSDKA